MGVWAAGSFESDSALDWLGQVYESHNFSLVRTALIGDFATAEIHVARKAVAAADLVACSRGFPPPEPKRRGLVDWTREHSAEFTPDLLEFARRAVAADQEQIATQRFMERSRRNGSCGVA